MAGLRSLDGVTLMNALEPAEMIDLLVDAGRQQELLEKGRRSRWCNGLPEAVRRLEALVGRAASTTRES